MQFKRKKSHYLIHYTIILSLLLGWLVFSLYFASKFSFSVLTYSYKKSDFVKPATTDLLKGQKVTARFQAKENNLGILSVRFTTHARINDDVVNFRIRMDGSDKWFYENNYKVDQFQNDEYFTFGFPIISDSQNKTYVFEIQSTKGRQGNSIALSSINPVFAAQYQFTKNDLMADKKILPAFVAKKIYYSFSDINFVVSSLLYLLPLAFYLIWYYLSQPIFIFEFKPRLKISVKSGNPLSRYAYNYVLVYLYLTSMLFLIIFINETSGLIDLMLIGLWLVLTWFYKFESAISFLVASLFLLLCPLLLIFNNELAAENSARLAYFLFVIGTFGSIIELKFSPKNLVNYKSFIRHFLLR